MQMPQPMRCIRWLVLVAVGSVASGCLSMIIPEHHPSTASDAGASAGSDDLGAAGTGGNGASGDLDAGGNPD
jgi:hypothetical protein